MEDAHPPSFTFSLSMVKMGGSDNPSMKMPSTSLSSVQRARSPTLQRRSPSAAQSPAQESVVKSPQYKMGVDVKMMVFSWNSNKMTITAHAEGSEYYKNVVLRSNKPDSSFPYFLTEVLKEIKKQEPHIIFFATQHSRKPGDGLHSGALKEMFEGHKDPRGIQMYEKLRKSRSIGLGGAGITGGLSGLRSTIYVRWDLYNTIMTEEEEAGFETEASLAREVSCGAGLTSNNKAIALYLRLHGTTFAFINVSIDDDKNGFKATFISKELNEKRFKHVGRTLGCLNKIIEDLVHKPLGPNKVKVDAVVLAGDFGLRYIPPAGTGNDLMNLLKKNEAGIKRFSSTFPTPNPYEELLKNGDELTKLLNQGKLKGNPHEGRAIASGDKISSVGPTFPPTCTLKKNRSDETCHINNRTVACPKGEDYLAKVETGYPSWCNRVLYFETSPSKSTYFICHNYYSFDHRSMKESPQTAVVAELEFGKGI